MQLQRSQNGTLPEHADVETVTRHLISLNNKLQASPASTDNGLQKLCASYNDVAEELLRELERLKRKGGQGKRQNVKQALHTMWKEKDIERLDQRLKKIS